jgi:DNA-binding IclR family transcriptional regulator
MAPAAAPSVAQRIIMTLEVCAAGRGPLTITEIVEETGLPKSTVHRTCWRLVDLGLLEHTRDGFVVGVKMFAMGSSNPFLNRIRVAAMPALHHLQATTEGMSNLAILNGDKALIIDALYGPRLELPPHVPRMVGASLPLHCTAVGKAIAASLEAPRREELLGDGPLPPSTWRSIVRPTLLREHLSRVAQEGLAVSDEEFMPGICGVAAAVHTRDATVAIGFVGGCNQAVARRVAGPVRQAAEALRAALA